MTQNHTNYQNYSGQHRRPEGAPQRKQVDGTRPSDSAHKRTKSTVLIAIVVMVAAIIASVGIIAMGKNQQQNLQISDSASIDTDSVAAISAAEEDPTTITISFTGDVILGRDKAANYDTSLDAKFAEVGDYSYFFKNFAQLFAEDDLTVVDFEGTLTDSTNYVDKEFNFKGPADYVNILLAGNVDAATLANNHTHDYGSQGFTDTQTTLENAGIKTFGYEDIAYVDVKGVSVALIGTYALSSGDVTDEMVNSINTARNNGAQVVIVYAHWGVEKSYTPTDYQVQLGRAAIDAGADLVLGTHPHVLQGWEEYNGHYIVYSLGNFCFGGNVHPYDMDCYVLQYTCAVNSAGVQSGQITIIPTQVSSQTSYNDYQPIMLEGDDYYRVMQKIDESNAVIAQM